MNESAIQTESLYQTPKKIHAREVEGRFDRLRTISIVSLLGIYYLLPWLQWSARQAVLFDLPARKFHIFGLTLWPQDFIFLSWLLIMAALLLFLATAVAGRVWCGYACPQTIWTEAFVWMERITEGKFNQRIKLDKAPWTSNKLVRKGAKRMLWLFFAVWTGFTFVGYFTPIQELGRSMLAFTLGPWEMFWIAFYSIATYANAGHLREQVCKYMCPYARFQSAMIDKDTLIVSYDAGMGEPRGPRNRRVKYQEAGLGACIDCNKCVQACPTGIDIREGLQYECISCASCIDACDEVMNTMKYPRGLIRYTTQSALQGGKTRVLRPRTVIYGALLASLFISFLYSLSTINAVQVDVIRDRNALYRELPSGSIENVYTLKILNKTELDQTYAVELFDATGLSIETDPVSPRLEAGEAGVVAARVRMDSGGSTKGARDIIFVVRQANDADIAAQRTARFFSPPL